MRLFGKMMQLTIKLCEQCWQCILIFRFSQLMLLKHIMFRQHAEAKHFQQRIALIIFVAEDVCIRDRIRVRKVVDFFHPLHQVHRLPITLIRLQKSSKVRLCLHEGGFTIATKMRVGVLERSRGGGGRMVGLG